MLTDNISPKTIDGIKSLAKAIKKREGIKHAEALDQAALQAGYSNFRNAQRNIFPKNSSLGKVSVFISAAWRDRSTKTSGQEVLELHFDTQILESLKPSNLKNCNYLWHFKIRASDHLEMKTNTDSQYRARQSIVQAARALQFISATGLRPSRSSTKAVANNNHYDALPKRVSGAPLAPNP